MNNIAVILAILEYTNNNTSRIWLGLVIVSEWQTNYIAVVSRCWLEVVEMFA